MKLICHEASRNSMVRKICDFAVRYVTPNHKVTLMSRLIPRENEFITFFICYMTLCDHVINRLCDFVDKRPALDPPLFQVW